MKYRLENLEARLQTLIEGSVARLFPSTRKENQLSHRLIEAMRQRLRTSPNGETLVPNVFTLSVHPTQEEELSTNHKLLDDLVESIKVAADKENFIFTSQPLVVIKSDEDVDPGSVQVHADYSQEELTETTNLELEHPVETRGIPVNAFLIVDGGQIFTLTQPVVNIGRRLGNHLIIDDPRISRSHAQLRAVRGRYVVFDLNSTGGTLVNGEPVHQCILYPGDVISLAGVPLVYGQDFAGDTKDYIPS